MICEIFPMFELTIDGLENAVSYMMQKKNWKGVCLIMLALLQGWLGFECGNL
jgi:hypothetical protein